MTQQKAIAVTGNNIANVNTPGYSRQRLNMEQNEPVRYQGGLMGSGVKPNRTIQRIYDRFLRAQINNEEHGLGRWQAEKEALEKVELMFDEASGYGLNNAMSKFWNSWQDLAGNPSGHVERTTLLADSQALTGTFNKLYTDVQKVQQDIDLNIKGTIDDVNRLSEQIADLNAKIARVEVNGQAANSYRDNRDLLLKELSAIIEVESFEDSDGYLTVSAGAGKPLVDNTNSWELTSADNGSGLQDVFWIDSSGATVNITSDLKGGKLKGWTEARDVIIPDYLNRLDTLAQGVINDVNGLHGSGFALDGSQNNFFTGSSASDMAVAENIAGNSDLIAASSTLAGIPGDNSNAIAIANLQNSLQMSGSSATYDDYYNSIISDVGSSVLNASVRFDHQITIVARMDNYREEVSGVSLDEEMVNLVKYQHAYDAAAKVISSADELLSTLINMI